MKWFKHDSNAHTDAKLKKLKHKYGIVGYGLYWYCIELIAGLVDKNNITFELEEDAELIALEWGLDQVKVQEIMAFMVNLKLFENNNGQITCLKLAKRLDDTNAKNHQIKNILSKLDKNLQNNHESVGETPNDSEPVGETQNNSGQNRIDKNRIYIREKPSRFQPPTLNQVHDYFIERSSSENPERFIDFYQSKNWMVGKNKMKDWKAAARNWIARASPDDKNQSAPQKSEAELLGI